MPPHARTCSRSSRSRSASSSTVSSAPSQKTIDFQLWYRASLLETATAGDCGKLYNIRPIDRGMLEFKRKRLENGLVCKLYLRMDVLKVARSVHSKKQASTIRMKRPTVTNYGAVMLRFRLD